MNIALIAHDKKKSDIVQFVTAYKHIFEQHNLYATGTTGLRIQEATDLPITRMQSGPLEATKKLVLSLRKMKWILFSFLEIH